MSLEEGIEAEVLSEETIQKRVHELADELVDAYCKEVSVQEPLVLVCVLKGSFVFASDLFRAIGSRVHTTIEFMQLSRGGQLPGAEADGDSVSLLTDLKEKINGKHCLVIEDIVDTAATLDYLRFILSARSPKSLAACVLVDKQHGEAEEGVGAEYTGFVMREEGRFLVGYGMDSNERFRSLPYIGALRDVVMPRPAEGAAPMEAVSGEDEDPFMADF